MIQITEAIYTQGVLRPRGELALREAQRVRLIVQPLDDTGGDQRSLALKRLLAGIEGTEFRSGGRCPTRDELHDRP
jgi:predicted DNA-binding antitoxin AbrB/MazE fold protein